MSLNGRTAYDVNYRRLLPSSLDAPILDIGCGTGEFLEYLGQLGYRDLTGVEINPARAEQCRLRTSARIDLTDDLHGYLGSGNRKYAFVSLKSVIAHFPRPELLRYLRAIRETVASDGKVLIETFNGIRWTGNYLLYNDFTHHWAFTEYSLCDALEAAGFRVESLSGEVLPSRGMRGLAWRGVQRLWLGCLKGIYFAERGFDRNPTIFSKYLIAFCSPT